MKNLQHYTISPGIPIIMAAGSAVGELLQDEAHLRELMPEPFDITNHAGNMGYGVSVALLVGSAYMVKRFINKDIQPLDSHELGDFRIFGTAAVCGITAAVNCLTETKWAVANLPFAKMLDGETADPLDAIYSVAYGGLGFNSNVVEVEKTFADYTQRLLVASATGFPLASIG